MSEVGGLGGRSRRRRVSLARQAGVRLEELAP